MKTYGLEGYDSRRPFESDDQIAVTEEGNDDVFPYLFHVLTLVFALLVVLFFADAEV